MSLKEIKSVVENELKEFDGFFSKELKSKAPLLNTILKYVLRKKGKQIRPLFVFLSAGITGKINPKTYRGAAMIELLHTATLVHDDVVDDSFQRRGLFSINALWKNKISVLVGDYMLSKGLLISVENGDYDLLEITSNAVKQMSEGELIQIEKARNLNTKEDIYFDIISKKTASLIQASCLIGAKSVMAGEKETELISNFGHNMGIAFQIKDDLLDFNSKDTGKPAGTDIKEKKLTLPLIYALNVAGKSEQRKILSLVSKGKNQKEVYEQVYSFINQFGGFEYAQDKMTEYKHIALDNLYNLPESSYRNAMEQLVEFTTSRKD